MSYGLHIYIIIFQQSSQEFVSSPSFKPRSVNPLEAETWRIETDIAASVTAPSKQIAQNVLVVPDVRPTPPAAVKSRGKRRQVAKVWALPTPKVNTPKVQYRKIDTAGNHFNHRGGERDGFMLTLLSMTSWLSSDTCV